MPVDKGIEKDHFSMVSNKLSQDEELTPEAKGIILEILSRPEDWIIYKSQLTRKHTGITKINRIFKELREAGFLHIFYFRNTGKIRDKIWCAFGKPKTNEEFLEYQKTSGFKMFLQRHYYDKGYNL